MFIKEYFNLVFTAKNFDDAAFPQTIDHEEGTILVKGLTKREYFAAMAMQAYITNGAYCVDEDARLAVESADALMKALNENCVDEDARLAVESADALMKALNKPQP